MNFVKGVLIGTVVTAGVVMAYSEGIISKKMMKRGKNVIKKMF